MLEELWQLLFEGRSTDKCGINLTRVLHVIEQNPISVYFVELFKDVLFISFQKIAIGVFKQFKQMS